MPDHAPTGRIVIAGGTGFLGRNLAKHLTDLGCEVCVISRHVPAEGRPSVHFQWDARTLGDWAQCLDGASAVVNLAGRSVDCVKTPGHCDEILRSRVEPTRLLGTAIRHVGTPPPVWVQMSTAHIYGDPPEIVCDEQAAFGYGLAPTVGRAWEDAFREKVLPETRQVVLRTSFVLGKNGGALPRLARLVRWRLGGTVGHGRQGISWIHQHDMNRIFARAIADEEMRGAYLTTAPQPVSNADFMRELRRALGITIGLPAKSWMVRWAAPLLMRTDPELALYGRYCVPRRLEEQGFTFDYPDLRTALDEIFGGQSKSDR